MSLSAATPAAAETCFQRIAVAFGHAVHPHAARVHVERAAHKAPTGPRVHRVRHVGATHPRPHPIATRYILRPHACPTGEAAPIASAMPGIEVAALAPETAADLLAGLRGPPAAAAADDQPAEVAALASDNAGPAIVSPPDSEDSTFPGFPPGGDEGGGFIPPGIGGGGGGGVFPTQPGAVPEPTTWAMLLIGFGAIGVSVRRRRRTA